MPYTPCAITVDPHGLTVDVNIRRNSASGSRVDAYTSQNGSSLHSFPKLISEQTTFWLAGPGTYYLSILVEDVERYGKTVSLNLGSHHSVSPEIPKGSTSVGVAAPKSAVPLDAREFGNSDGSSFELGELVAEMERTGRPAYLHAGTNFRPTGTVLLGETDPDFTYHFRGDGRSTVLTLPDGMEDGDFLIRHNVDEQGDEIETDFRPHPRLIIEHLTIDGGTSTDGGFIRSARRSAVLRRLRMRGFKYGWQHVAGYSDMVRVEHLHASDMTAGGWVFDQQYHGDGLIIEHLIAYACAGVRLDRCQGATITGLISGWHHFRSSDVMLIEPHLEGDGTTDDTPLITIEGSRVHIPNGRIYTTPYRPAIKIDDSGAYRRKSRVHLGPMLTFPQRIDAPSSDLGSLLGVAIHIADLGESGELSLEKCRADIYAQSSGGTRLTFDPLAPRLTSDVPEIQALVDASPAVTAGSVVLRSRSGQWEFGAQDPLSGVVATRRATGSVGLTVTAGAVAAYATEQEPGTYYYRACSIDQNGRKGLGAAEVDVTTTTSNPNAVIEVDARVAPSTVRLWRGTETGTYTHWVDIPVATELQEFFDQGSTIAGYAWSDENVPPVPSTGELIDGLKFQGSMGRLIGMREGAPASGTYETGDFILNNRVGTSTVLGWVCTAGGSPGTWVRYGGPYAGSGPQAQRPSAANAGVGSMWFNTDTNVPNWSTGSSWVVGEGAQGEPGQGLASGGDEAELLIKQSSDDYDTAWGAITGGTGIAVTAAKTGISIASGGIDSVSKSANYTVELADANKCIDVNSSSAVAVTIPANSSVAFPLGTVLMVCRLGSGEVTVDTTGLTVVNPYGTTDLRAQGSTVSFRKIGTDTWVASGDFADS